MVAFKERGLGVELRSATKPEPRDSGRMRARALDRGASTATTPAAYLAPAGLHLPIITQVVGRSAARPENVGGTKN